MYGRARHVGLVLERSISTLGIRFIQDASLFSIRLSASPPLAALRHGSRK